MSGPTTRPIRDDRHLRGAVSNQGSDSGGDQHQGREPDHAPNDFAADVAKSGSIREAALRRFATHCGTCGVIFLMLLAWMLGAAAPIGIGSPFAKAGEVEELKVRAQKTADVVAEMYSRQLSADIRSYQESLCRGRNMFLEGELERAQREYEKQTGRRYPAMPCQ